MTTYQQSQPVEDNRFELLVKQNELTPQVAKQLTDTFQNTEVVVLIDDSTSMNAEIKEENPNMVKSSPVKVTRWTEAKRLAQKIIEWTTAIKKGGGIDIYFFNRPKLSSVTTMMGLQATFANPPNGSTPLLGTLRQIYRDKKNLAQAMQLLIVIISDGEPSDGSTEDLYYVLNEKSPNVHVSFAECTDREETMAYLDRLDGRVVNFDNTDDYREDLRKVKAKNGQNYKYTYDDYVIKILLATFIKSYYNLDQPTSQQTYSYQLGNRYTSGQQYDPNDDCCPCVIL